MSKPKVQRTILFGVTIDYQLRYHDGLYQRLADAGWDVHLVSGRGPIGTRLDQHRGITVHEIAMARNPAPWADLKSLVAWIELLRDLRPNVVVIGTPKAGLLGSIAAFLSGARTRIYELHGLRLESASGSLHILLRSMERLTCAVSTTVVAVSHSLQQLAIREGLTHPNKIDVLGAGSPNGVNIEHYSRASQDQATKTATRAALGIDEDVPIISFVGRLTADKGLSALEEAMTLVGSTTPAHLLVIGAIDDESGRLGAEALRSALSRVSFTGEVDDVAEYLAITDVLCLPSRREGLPTVVLEAFAATVPVVGTRATGITDLVVDGETGLLVDIDDVDALRDALLRILRDGELARQLTGNAGRLVAKSYARDIVQQRWQQMLEAGGTLVR